MNMAALNECIPPPFEVGNTFCPLDSLETPGRVVAYWKATDGFNVTLRFLDGSENTYPLFKLVPPAKATELIRKKRQKTRKEGSQ